LAMERDSKIWLPHPMALKVRLDQNIRRNPT
jgi:hypothetical protein